MLAMNSEPALEDVEERTGCSSHIGKLICSAGADQLALVAYVPDSTRMSSDRIDVTEWMRHVCTKAHAAVTKAARTTNSLALVPTTSRSREVLSGRRGKIVCAVAASTRSPERAQEAAIAAAIGFLRGKGRLPPSLFDSAAIGDAASLRALLSTGGYVDERDAWEQTPLHHACIYGQRKCAVLLLDALRGGAGTDAIDGWGNTPIHYACTWGHAHLVRLLLDRGAEVKLANNQGILPRDWALRLGHVLIVRILDDTRASAADRRARWAEDMLRPLIAADLVYEPAGPLARPIAPLVRAIDDAMAAHVRPMIMRRAQAKLEAARKAAERAMRMRAAAESLGVLQPLIDTRVDTMETVASAMLYCSENGVESVADIVEDEQLEKFIRALPLKPLQARKLRGLLQPTLMMSSQAAEAVGAA